MLTKTLILADKAYGTKEIRTYLHDQSARYTIPPKVNTKQPWPFDKETYKRRNVIERFFNRLKEFRRAETRYDKRDDLFLAFVIVACPPMARFSITATCNPALAAYNAAEYPPGPPPMITISYIFAIQTSYIQSEHFL